MENNIRVGIGYDSHPLVPGRKLILGGITIPFTRGLEGWSDADVLTHAIIEALFGAAALGDIGQHFPPGEPKYKDVSSLVLLTQAYEMLSKNDWQIGNIDTTLVSKEPKLKDYINAMREKISNALGIDIGRINIKASTNNGLGAIGRGDGISAYAVALIEHI